jgi:hypothetical protein
MAKKKVQIEDGKITVIIQDKYDVYSKPLPDGLDPEVEWLGNFGIKEAKTGKKQDGKVPKYEIVVREEKGKTLVYWDGKEKKAVPNQKAVGFFRKNKRKGELDLGDPPVGWN